MQTCDLRGVSFRGANLTEIDLQHCQLNPIGIIDMETGKKARDWPSDLSGATAISANLRSADMRGVILSNVSFDRADLSFADFTDAEISGMTMNSAKTERTKFPALE
jgi:uncharacterized protein YjbI with pentapeptide repeats